MPERNTTPHLEGKAESIPRDNSDFDVVFATYVLHWCEDIDAVLKSCSAVMKQGGKFGFVGITDQLNTNLCQQDDKMFSQEFRIGYASSIFPINLDRLTTENNFEVIVSKTHIQEIKFKDVMI